MTEFSDDALALRIATLEIPVDVSRVTQRALAARRKPRGLSIRWRVLAAVPLALLLVSAAASYYAPVFAQALADAPLAGSISGPMLRQFGLAGMPHRVSAFGARVSSGGYTAARRGAPARRRAPFFAAGPRVGGGVARRIQDRPSRHRGIQSPDPGRPQGASCFQGERRRRERS